MWRYIYISHVSYIRSHFGSMLGSKEGPALGGHQRNMHRGRPPLVQVTCTSQDGAKEEVHVVPLAMAFSNNWTVGDLLKNVRQRIKRVPVTDVVALQLQGNDGIGGRLYEEDLLETVLKDGDALICSSTDEGRGAGSEPARGSDPQSRCVEHGAARTPVGAGSGSGKLCKPLLKAKYEQVFGDSVKEEVYAASESPTPPHMDLQQELNILLLHHLLSLFTAALE